MSHIQSQFSVLKEAADRAVADAIVRLIEDGEDHELNRINALDFSKRTGFDEEKVISASCMPRGLACSISPGTCFVLVAAACWTRTTR